MNKLCSVIIIIFTMITINLFAQERTLTLNESIEIGLRNNDNLHSSKMAVKIADARLSEINTNRLPSLKFDAAYTRLSEVDPFIINTPFGDFNISPVIVNNYNFKLSLQQPIFTGFKLSSSSNIAEYNYEAAKEDYNRDEQNLILNIKKAYWNLFKAEKVKEFVKQNEEQIKAHLNDIQNFYNQGLSTKNDLLKVQVELSNAQLREIDAQNNVKLARLSLNNIINIPLLTETKIQDSIISQANRNFELDQLIYKASENRPELKSLQYKIKTGESAVTLAQSGWFPQIYLTGNYYYSRPNQRIIPAQDKFKDTWDVSLTLSYDLWNWGAAGDKTEQAEAQLEQVKDSYKIISDNIQLEVTQSYLNIIQNKEKISVSLESVKQAKENYRVTNEMFKNGLALNTDLLDAEVALLQANTNYIQALVDYEIAKAELEKSIGEKNL